MVGTGSRPAQRGRQGSGWQGCGPGLTSSHARQLSPRAPGEVAVAKDTTPRTGDLAEQLRPGAWRPSPHVLELKPPAGSAVVTGAPPRPRMGALEALQRPKASSAQPEPSPSRAQAERGSDTPRGRPELGLLQRAGASWSLAERDGDGGRAGRPLGGGQTGLLPTRRPRGCRGRFELRPRAAAVTTTALPRAALVPLKDGVAVPPAVTSRHPREDDSAAELSPSGQPAPGGIWASRPRWPLGARAGPARGSAPAPAQPRALPALRRRRSQGQLPRPHEAMQNAQTTHGL